MAYTFMAAGGLSNVWRAESLEGTTGVLCQLPGGIACVIVQ